MERSTYVHVSKQYLYHIYIFEIKEDLDSLFLFFFFFASLPCNSSRNSPVDESKVDINQSLPTTPKHSTTKSTQPSLPLFNTSNMKPYFDHLALLSFVVARSQLFMASARNLQSQASSWNVVTEITGTATFQVGLKHSLDLNYDGSTLAVSAMYSSDGGLTDQGGVRVYDVDFTSQIATQRGNALFGANSNHLFGSSVCLADGGDFMYVGAPGARNNNGVSIN